MTLDEIEALAVKLRQSGLAEIECCKGDVRVALRAMPQQTGQRAVPPALEALSRAIEGRANVQAPYFGRYRARHPQRTQPEVAVGREVAKGDIAGFVEIEGALLPAIFDRAGTIKALLAEDGEIVGYGQPLAELA